MPTVKLGISDANRVALASLLNVLVADESVLAAKLRSFHWNVTGNSFSELHALFGSQYSSLDAIIDTLAERVRQLGGTPISTLAEILKKTRLKESTAKEQKAMLLEALADHEALIVNLRKEQETCQTKLGDAGTSNILIGLMNDHEKMAWFLRSHL